jgi:hypothetical protein
MKLSFQDSVGAMEVRGKRIVFFARAAAKYPLTVWDRIG